MVRRPKERARIIRSMERELANIDAMRDDVAHWNALNPGEAPINPDPDGNLRRIGDMYRRTLAAEPEMVVSASGYICLGQETVCEFCECHRSRGVN
jgi:hypothetical protein